ncbi:MAG: glycosyltransferase [Phycisphaeraceae bacterium]|nr:glycosyltransferase [Phycisphaeraceae bacterium]
MRVMHVINCLSVGGTERQLLRLAAAQQADGDEVRIVTLLAKDTLREEAERAGLRVEALGLHGALALPRSLSRLRRSVAEFQPEVVQSWLYWANLASLIALGRRRKTRVAPIAWNIRQSLPKRASERLAMRLAIRLGARWSPLVDALIFNAEEARQDHHAAGYRNKREIVIHNAFDSATAPHGEAARRDARRRLGIPDDAQAIAHAARFHPMKDHAGFLVAVAPLLAARRDLIIVLFGRGVTAEACAEPLAEHAALRDAHHSGRLRFDGERLDLPEILPAFDLLVSSSAWGEAFANVLAEALMAEVPVVATDIGAARSIVQAAGRVVPPRDTEQLRSAIADLLARPPSERQALGRLGREHIEQRWGVEAVLHSYRAVWGEITHAAADLKNPA